MEHKVLYCNNCNKKGHKYSKCLYPINSYGIILYKKYYKTLKFLMIQRKYSYSLKDILLAKYMNYNNIDNTNEYYILAHMISFLPVTERYILLNYDFIYIWKKIWIYSSNDICDNFVYYYNTYNKYYSLIEYLINNINPILKEPEWEFAKGKRNIMESDIDCAIRECNEETGYNKEDYYIYPNLKIFQDKFIGTDRLYYCNNYFLGKVNNYNKKLYYDSNNFLQSSEIRKIGWFTLEDIENKINKLYPQRYNMIRHINYLLEAWNIKAL